MAASLGQATHRVHRCGSQPDQKLSSADQRESFLLFNRPMRDRTEYLRIEPRVTRQLLGIYIVALAVAVRDGPQLTHVGDNHLVT